VSDRMDSGSGVDSGGTAGPGPGAFPGNAPPPPPPPTAASTPRFASAPPPPPQYPGGAGQYPGAYPPPSPQWESGPSGPVYASWGIRVGGYLIDFVIFAAVTVVLVLLMRHSHTLEIRYMMKRGTQRQRSISALPLLIGALLYLVYGTIFCGSRRGQTVGMMAVGVRAVRDGTFERLGYARAGLRAVTEVVLRSLELLSPFLILVWLIDVLYPIWDKKRQTLHDKAGGSVVLRGQPPTG
jgi:uncharacterized RDD family membrane protein YckC